MYILSHSFTFPLPALTPLSRTDYMSMNAEDPKRLGEIDWDTWFNKPGMPQKPLFGDKLAAFSKLAATGLVDICTADAVDECKVEALFKQTEVATWKSASQVVFLDALLGILGSTKHASSVWDNVLKVLAKFSFNESNNCEIKFRFLTLHVRLEKKECLEDACKFAISYGRMKFCRPMFRDLYKSEMGKKAAVETFVANASFFHNIAKKMIAKDLNVKL